MSVEKRFFPEDHGRQHAAQRPHVEGVVVHLVVDQQFGPLKVPVKIITNTLVSALSVSELSAIHLIVDPKVQAPKSSCFIIGISRRINSKYQYL